MSIRDTMMICARLDTFMKVRLPNLSPFPLKIFSPVMDNDNNYVIYHV